MMALVQMMPDRFWIRTGLNVYLNIDIRSPLQGLVNRQLVRERADGRPTSSPLKGTPLPVITLGQESLRYWAKMLAGGGNIWVPGVLLPPRRNESETAERSLFPNRLAPPPRTAEELVKLFFATASRMAQRLAFYLAAGPLTLPIMRLVQQALLPDSKPTHLAEVWLSGLIDRPEQFDYSQDPEQIEFEFIEGARVELVNHLRFTETLDVLNVVSDYIGKRAGQILDFEALIVDLNETGSGDLKISQAYRNFAKFAHLSLKQFGGRPYEVTRQLHESLVTDRLTDSHARSTNLFETGRDQSDPLPGQDREVVTTHALLIGINRYEDSTLPQFKACVDDAEKMGDWLLRGDPLGSVILTLTDEKATKASIVAW